MKRENLFRAIAGIDDCFIAEAIRYDPPSASGSSERIVHLNKKKIISFALAAVLMLSLGIAAYATYNAISTPQAAEKVAQEQLARWRELGILPPDAIFEGEADQIYLREKRIRSSRSRDTRAVLPGTAGFSRTALMFAGIPGNGSIAAT